MRHTVAIIAGSVVAALATGGILAVSGGAQSPGGSTIKLVTKNCTRKYVDVPPRGRGPYSPPGVGDSIAGSCQTFDQSGRGAGAFDVTCTFTKGGRRPHDLCDAAYSLAGGDLHAVARPDNKDETAAGSIVGGTGAYAGARGTFTSVERPGNQEQNGTPKDDTITLLP